MATRGITGLAAIVNHDGATQCNNDREEMISPYSYCCREWKDVFAIHMTSGAGSITLTDVDVADGADILWKEGRFW